MCFTYDVIIGIVLEKMMYVYLREWMRLKIGLECEGTPSLA